MNAIKRDGYYPTRAWLSFMRSVIDPSTSQNVFDAHLDWLLDPKNSRTERSRASETLVTTTNIDGILADALTANVDNPNRVARLTNLLKGQDSLTLLTRIIEFALTANFRGQSNPSDGTRYLKSAQILITLLPDECKDDIFATPANDARELMQKIAALLDIKPDLRRQIEQEPRAVSILKLLTDTLGNNLERRTPRKAGEVMDDKGLTRIETPRRPASTQPWPPKNRPSERLGGSRTLVRVAR